MERFRYLEGQEQDLKKWATQERRESRQIDIQDRSQHRILLDRFSKTKCAENVFKNPKLNDPIARKYVDEATEERPTDLVERPYVLRIRNTTLSTRGNQ